MTGIYLLLGTNLGKKAHNIQVAKEFLTAKTIIVRKESKIYETAAWGIEDQPSFLNQVIEVDAPYTPQKLLEICASIEKEMGRERFEKWGERLIDIDILYFGDMIIEEDNLNVPHPQIPNRRFTLVPLSEIAPEFKNPILGKLNSELLDACKDELQVSAVESPYL